MQNKALIGIFAILSLSTYYYFSESNQFGKTLNHFNDNQWFGFTLTTDFTTQDLCLSTFNTTPVSTNIFEFAGNYVYEYFSYGDGVIKHKSGNNVNCSLNTGNYKIKQLDSYYSYGGPYFSQLSPVQSSNNILYGQTYQNQVSAQQGIGNKTSQQVLNQESLWIFNTLNTSNFGLQIQDLLDQNIEPFSGCQDLKGRWKGQFFTREFTDQANCVTQVDLKFQDLGNQEFSLEGKTNGSSFSNTEFLYQTCPYLFIPIYGHCEGSENKLILDGEKGIGLATDKFILIQKEDANLVLIKE